MHTITAVNVNEVYPLGIDLLDKGGIVQPSQYGETLEMPYPMSVCYLNPRERCQFDPVRDSNPFLNLFEALWILAGRQDVKFLQELVENMARYSDSGHVFYGAYGARMRGTSSYYPDTVDQVEEAISRLKSNPNDRQVAILIRYPQDSAYKGKDQPCNMIFTLKIRDGKLNIHVFNRSNDFIWGLTGTNVVQFSMIQEYIAGRVGVEIGTYHQTTDSMHVYKNEQWDKIRVNTQRVPVWDLYTNDAEHVKPYPMYTEGFDEDLHAFFKQYDENTGMGITRVPWKTGFFQDLVFPAWYSFQAYKNYRETKREASLEEARRLALDIPADWGVMIRMWLDRRGTK